MIVRDLFDKTDDVQVIARAIFEDRCLPQNIYQWITKYYSQIQMLKSVKAHKSDMMLFMDVYEEDRRLYGDISGVEFADVVADKVEFYALELLDLKQYAMLYVPDYSILLYGEEVIASEALRELGFHGYDENIKCPDEIRLKVLKALDGMQQEIFKNGDREYAKKCIKQFRAEHEGRTVPQWEAVKPQKQAE